MKSKGYTVKLGRKSFSVVGILALLGMGYIVFRKRDDTEYGRPHEDFAIRGSDPMGSGHYGASRGSRKHNGIDIVTVKGKTVKSPIDGKVTKHSQPYANDTKYRGIQIDGINEYEDIRIKIFYCLPTIDIGKEVKRKQAVAKSQDITEKYGGKSGGMTNHIHLEVWHKIGASWDRVDPTPYFT